MFILEEWVLESEALYQIRRIGLASRNHPDCAAVDSDPALTQTAGDCELQNGIVSITSVKNIATDDPT
jgi:hypothetical protein